MTTLYETLGIEPDASKAKIKAAYRREAQRAHPDRKGGSEAEFKRINQAYRLLTDDTKRARYDESGQTDEQHANAPMTDEQHAVIVLKQLFVAVLVGKPPMQPGCLDSGKDPIITLRAEINKGMREGPTAISVQRRRITKLEKARDKQLKGRKTTTPVLEQALAVYIESQKAILAQQELGLRIGPLMLDMLKAYSWEDDELSEQQRFMHEMFKDAFRGKY